MSFKKSRLLICGGTGFIGRNLCEHFARNDQFEVHATRFQRRDPGIHNVIFHQIDLRDERSIDQLVSGFDIILQAAATTSGAKDIVHTPELHVTDNSVMNAYLFRAAHRARVNQLVYFSCSVMYPSLDRLVKEGDFHPDTIYPKYFGVAWTKVYLERLAEFYSRLGNTRFTVIRHSNIYGPHDKYDLEKSHVFGATVTKVLSRNDKIPVWGSGQEVRDFLYVDDLCEFVERSLSKQTDSYCLVNVGSGKAVSIIELIENLQNAAGKCLPLEFDLSKPSLPVKIILDCERARELFDWRPKTDLKVGIEKTLKWCRTTRRNGVKRDFGRESEID